MKSHIRNDTFDLTKTIWDLCLLNTLHCDFGFGEKRLKQFYEKLEETQRWFSDYSCATGSQYTNMDSAVIKLITNMGDVDWKEIINIDQIVINGKDLTKIADKINNRNKGANDG